MPLFLPGRSRRRPTLFVLGAALVAFTLVAYVTQATHSATAAAAPAVATVPSTDEAAAGALALSQSYPGGLPALLDLFDTGECAGIESYDTAPPECQSTLDQIAALGSGQSFPEVIPDLSGPPDETVPPEQSPDPGDQVTEDMLAEMEAEGAPQDLIDGLRQDPPVIPPQYNTLPAYEGGPETMAAPTSLAPGGAMKPDAVAPTLTSSTDTTVPPPSSTTLPPSSTSSTVTTTSSTSTTLPTSTTDSTGPTSTTDSTGPTSTTDTTGPTSTTDTTGPTTTVSTTLTTTLTTTTAPPPPPPPPPMLVAVGDSITSGHEARPGARFWQPWRTTCDDPGTGAAAPGSSWAGNLRALLGVPWNRYFNFAHSGSSTNVVRFTTPYTNPCGVVTQPARSQLADARAVLAAWPSQPGLANVAVADAGVNNTNWVGVVTRLVSRRMGGAIAGLFGAAPGWAVANPGACSDYVHGNPAGNPTPGAPPGAIPPAWNGVASSGAMAAGVAAIALGLITADRGAQVRWLLYYSWIGDPNLPNVCNPAAIRGSRMMNGWIRFGILVSKIVFAFMLGNPNRIQAVCQMQFNPGPGSIQTRLISFGIPNWALIPGYPHPNAAGRGALAGCVNGTLPRAAGGGIA